MTHFWRVLDLTCCSNTQLCSYNTLELTTRKKCVIYEDKPKTRQERVLHNTPKCVSKQHTKSVLFCHTCLKYNTLENNTLLQCQLRGQNCVLFRHVYNTSRFLVCYNHWCLNCLSMIIIYNFILGKNEKQQCRIITFRDCYISGYDLNVSVILKPLRLLSPDH